MRAVPIPPPCPDREQKWAPSDSQSAVQGGSSSHSSTMASQGISCLLRLYVLLLLARTLDPASCPSGDTVPVDVVVEEPEQQNPLVLEALSWSCSALGVLINGVFLGWHIGKRLRRHCREVRDGGQAGGMVLGVRELDQSRPWSYTVSGEG